MNLVVRFFVPLILLAGSHPAVGKSVNTFWNCPAGYAPKEGLNRDFRSDGHMRALIAKAAGLVQAVLSGGKP